MDTIPASLSRPDASSQDSLLKLLYEFGQGFGDDRATVISRLGAPQRVGMKATVQGIDSIFVLEYPGASFEGVRWTAGQHEMLFEIRVRGPLPGLPPAPTIGATTRAQLVTMLGSPDSKDVRGDSTFLAYQLPNPDRSDLLEFSIVRDTVRVARWRFRMG